MSQYQRMVSYLYQYHQGEKGENVGYVRVERRQQQCRIIVKMRSLALEHMPEIRLFIQEPDGLVYVPAGNLSAGGNSLEKQLVTMSEDVFRSGKSIDSFEGLLLYVSAKTYFATSWKNDHIFLGDMRTFADSEAAISTNPENINKSPNETRDESALTVNSEIAQTVQNNTANIDSHISHDTTTVPDGIKEQNTCQSENDTLSKHNINDIHAAMVEGELTAAEENIANMSLRNNTGNKLAGNNQNNKNERSVNESEEFDENEVEIQSVCSICPFKRKTLDYGKRMLYTFPHMHPFPDDRVRECVRIEPQDIGCLPIRLWSLANNNFLLQGYFNYRHLLFLELKDGNYAVGVPGIFTQKENGTAHRFAFPQFMPLSSEENCNGAFGYWLQTLPRTLT